MSFGSSGPRVAGGFLYACALFAQSTFDVHGIIHDPAHRPLPFAQIVTSCGNDSWKTTVEADQNGEFTVPAAPAGTCRITASASNFDSTTQDVVVGSKLALLHFQLTLKQVNESVDVSAKRLDTQISTVRSTTSAQEVEQTPGADQTNSLQMITAFVPGAYMVHDMLHVRGGHQVNWFLDGVPVINTGIAANVAPFINPKNVDELESQRGGYSSEYGDRTYGFFNVVTPSGFSRDNQAELITSYGNFYTTDDQFNYGGHTERLAYFGSIDGNRSNLGLGTPTSQVIHDQESGLGGFLSLLYNPTAKDQLRWTLSARGDHYQIPNTPDQETTGIRDIDLERDVLLGFSWTHTLSEGLLFSVTPYFHFNSARYLGGPNDTPFVLDDRDQSNYVGGRAFLQAQKQKHNARAGVEIWGQRDSAYFGLVANPPDAATPPLLQRQTQWANSDALFLEDQYQPHSWLTLDVGMRLTHYGGLVNENAADPRLGAAIRIPRLRWIVRGYYSYYYQPPPLNSVSGPLLQFALQQGFGFVPLHGERDIQHDFGLTVPLRNWALDVDNFHTSARNFLDHDVIGNSGIFVPLTDLGAVIHGTEVSLSSPEIGHTARLRVAYSNQLAEGVGPISGGLLEESDVGRFLLDHDQRNTVSVVLSLRLPGRVWATPTYSYGSGFLDGDGPDHLPANSLYGLSLGKHFGDNWSASVNATNLANTRYLLDNSNTFGGTHFVNPRQIYGELRFRFHL